MVGRWKGVVRRYGGERGGFESGRELILFRKTVRRVEEGDRRVVVKCGEQGRGEESLGMIS